MITTVNKLLNHQLKAINSLLYRISQLPTNHFYSKHFSKNQVDSKTLLGIHGVDEIEKFPFITKQNLLAASPLERSLEPMENVVRCHATSGTTSDPLIMLYSQKDIEQWGSLTKRILLSNGVTSQDVVQISFGYGLFTGGLGFHYGAEQLGALVVPISTGNTFKQIQMMERLKTNVLLCTPSYAGYLAECFFKNEDRESLVEPKNLSLKKIICGGERMSKRTRENIKKKLGIGISIYENYGLTEMYGPGVAFETEKSILINEQNESRDLPQYLYVNEDYFLPEIIDSLSGEKLKDGETGELVLTSFKNNTMPLIRYRTGDVTHLLPVEEQDDRYSEYPFRCIAKISHRCDDLIILKGVNFYPGQIEDVLRKWEEISPIYEIHLVTENHKDILELHLESSHLGEKKKHLKTKIAQTIQQIISLKPVIAFHPTGSLKQSEGKRQIVYDKRQ